MVVKRTKFKSCFISAPFGSDTSILREILDEKGIRWHDQTDVRAGGSWLDALDTAMTHSDFVCVVLPTDRSRDNVLFELGIAWARRKPVLAFLGPSLSLPPDIVSLTYFRLESTDREAVRSALEAFLAHAGPIPSMKPVVIPPKRRAKPKPYTLPPASATALELEQRTIELLREAGFILSEPSESRDQGADFAVWIDEVQHSLGNPLLVQVKAGDLSRAGLEQAASQLRSYVAKTHGRCGLLVYWDRQGREYPPSSVDWPLIFSLSGGTLARLASQGILAQELIRLRNNVVHGKT
jgi:hypothetical protein